MVGLAWLPVVCEKWLVINNLYTVLANLCICCGLIMLYVLNCGYIVILHNQ